MTRRAATSTILLLGNDASLLEGLAQTLCAVGHRAVVVDSLRDATSLAARLRPLVALVSHDMAASEPAVATLPLAPGGALVLYRGAQGARPQLDAAVQRATLAELALPLERTRLLALLRHLEQRASSRGRHLDDGQPPATTGGGGS